MASPGPFNEDRPPYRTKYKNRLRLRMWLCFAGGFVGFLATVFTFGSGIVFLPLTGFVVMGLGAYGFDHYRQKLKDR